MEESKVFRNVFSNKEFHNFTLEEQIGWLKKEGRKIAGLRYQFGEEDYNRLFKNILDWYFSEENKKNKYNITLLNHIQTFFEGVFSGMAFEDSFHLNSTNINSLDLFYKINDKMENLHRTKYASILQKTKEDTIDPVDKVNARPITLLETLNPRKEIVLERWTVREIFLDYRFWNAVDGGLEPFRILKEVCPTVQELKINCLEGRPPYQTTVDVYRKVANSTNLNILFQRMEALNFTAENCARFLELMQEKPEHYINTLGTYTDMGTGSRYTLPQAIQGFMRQKGFPHNVVRLALSRFSSAVASADHSK
ncbi:MAG: hypothetical protein PHY80_01075 [Rickettsiales bacterium]|nr:hypothetical protein [Rickettsiales bacterium]